LNARRRKSPGTPGCCDVFACGPTCPHRQRKRDSFGFAIPRL
jgi:hypothetical protein